MNMFIVALGRVSAQAALLVLLVLLVQRLFKSRLSPRWRCALWLLPAMRLLLPVSFSTGLSLFNLAPSWVFSRTPSALPPSLANTQPTDHVVIHERNFVFPFQATAEQIQSETETQRKFDPPSIELGKAAHGLTEREIAGSLPSVSKKTAPPPAAFQLLPTPATATKSADWPVILFAIWFPGRSSFSDALRSLAANFPASFRMRGRSPTLGCLTFCRAARTNCA
jgi:hypothetical protein